MKKAIFNSWLTQRIETQAKITIAACAGMAALGLLALIVQGGLLYVVFSLAYGSRFLAATVVLLIIGGMGAFTYLTAPKQLTDTEHEVSTGFKTVTIKLAPTLAMAWTFAIGSLESDQSIPQRIISLLMLIPRLFWTAWYVFGRIEYVKAIDPESCGKVLRLVLKKSERVDVAEVAEKYPDIDISKTMREISLIDGVVFLTKGSVGISLANRFKDALEEGLSKDDGSVDPDASPFNG